MRWSDLPFGATERTLRRFAGLWLAFFAVLSAWRWSAGAAPGTVVGLAAAGVIVGVAGLVRPALIRPVFVLCLAAAFPIGWFVSRLFLLVVFFGLFTPIALAFKLMGRDALALRPRQVESYWTPKEMPADPRAYLKQF